MFTFSLNIACHQLLHLEGHGAVGAANHAEDGASVVELVTRLLTWNKNNTSTRIIYVRIRASDIQKTFADRAVK